MDLKLNTFPTFQNFIKALKLLSTSRPEIDIRDHLREQWQHSLVWRS